jgi:HlyD family secretion protein
VLESLALTPVEVGRSLMRNPGIAFAATLEDLSPLGHTGQFTDTVRSFTARFSIQGTDPKLLPDLSAALDLDLGSQDNLLAVPRQSVAFEPGHSFVWVKGSAGFEKRQVQTGLRNDLEVAVLSGIKEGELIRRVAAEEPQGAERQ